MSKNPTERKRVARGAGMVLTVVTIGAAAALLTAGNDAPDANTPAPPPPITVAAPERAAPEFSARELAAIRRDQQQAAHEHGHDEPDATLERSTPVTDVPAGARGAGALGRLLPLRSGPWLLTLQTIDARRGVSTLVVTRVDGVPMTHRAAVAVVRRTAQRLQDDPGAYEALVPMSALKGAREQKEADHER